MSIFNREAIEALNRTLEEELDKAGEALSVDGYKAACNINQFWSHYLYPDASVEDGAHNLLSELETKKPAGIIHALAIYTIIRSDFWNGNESNLDEIPDKYKNRIKKAAEQILEVSKQDTVFFGATS